MLVAVVAEEEGGDCCAMIEALLQRATTACALSQNEMPFQVAQKTPITIQIIFQLFNFLKLHNYH